MHWYRAIDHHASKGDPYVVATVLATSGSAPRPAGTKMVIAQGREHDTLGGGQLEHLVIARARELLSAQVERQQIEHFPLAAAALQCCGGSVTVLLECFAAPAMRLAVFGAGHIGQRVVELARGLQAQVLWFDDATRGSEGDLDEALQRGALQTFSDTGEVIANLPKNTQLIILSHDHQLDYALLEAALHRGSDQFAGIGMIGSATKWQRFSKRLEAAGFSAEDIGQVRCPLGAGTATDKQPLAIAIAIVNELLNLAGQEPRARHSLETTSTLSWRQVKSALLRDELFTDELFTEEKEAKNVQSPPGKYNSGGGRR